MDLDLDPGLAATGNPALVRRIVAEMDGGTIPFERFMELALYSPDHGYYRKPGRMGRGGDFLTSPVIHPMFGWTVAAWIREVWAGMGSPSEFTVFEPGAGQGQLAASVLDWFEGRDEKLARAVRYQAIEPNAAGSDGRVGWVDDPEPADAGLVVSNELFDALAVRMFDASERGPVEVHVRWNGEVFEEARGPVATIDGAPEQGRFEVSPNAFPLMRRLCGLIRRGAVLTFDYGYPRDELYAPWRTTGTLLCFYKHTSHEDPFKHVGEQDITSHVNFTELKAAAESEGCDVLGPTSQTEFLTNMGVGQLVESARSDMQDYFERRNAVQQLTDAAGLGRIRVMAAFKHLNAVPPGFESGE
jgi:SAM-dependent MidA family methyltransferase